MPALATLVKMIEVIVKSHPNPTVPIQELYDNSTDKREKEEITVLAYGWRIKINEEEN